MRILFLPVLLFFSSFALAQKNLSDSRRNSVNTYIYKINTKEATDLYRSDMGKVSETYLHTLIDSFKTKTPVLLPANYLFVRAENNKLVFTLHSVGDVQYKIINNNHDLIIALHTKEGKLITSGEVYINKKKLLYDAATQTFRKEKWDNAGLLRVYYNNVLYAFAIEKNRAWKPKFWQRVSNSFPLKYVIKPFKNWFRKSHSSYNNYFYSTSHEKGFKGFAVFNKPKYKPGDTVKLKAFITTSKGKPIDDKLLLRLTGSEFDVDTVIAIVTPYRKGGYEYSFVLSDSLHMDLDEEYLVTFEEEKSKKYNLETYDGDLDDEEYAAKRAIVMRGKFYYEEYELESISFSARSSKESHSRGDEVAVFVKASDENEIAVMDGRIQVVVKPSIYGTKKFTAPKVFLPDTLWQHEQPLETIGETKIIIPDSIFPEASFDYEIACIFLNTSNEIQTQVLYQHFSSDVEKISFKQQNDSLHIEYLVKGKSTAVAATAYGFSEKADTVEQRELQLPTTIKIHPFVKNYEVEKGDLNEEYEVQNKSRAVSALASRTKDSVNVRLVNPYHLPVWYTVFAGNKIVLRGLGDSLLYADKVQTAKHYFLSLQYIYNDKVYNEDYTIPYQEKLLSVSVIQPDAIYPGQTAAVTINVKDAEGKPVADADVTAWSYTKKFKNAGTPSVPYLGNYFQGRKRYSTFRPNVNKEYNNSIKLAWQRWSLEMNLDTIEYYKFLHPQTIYANTEAAPDSLTQIAPFIVIDGDLQPVNHIYIDEVPVFFNAANGLQQYSFAVSPGKHSFRFRMQDKLIFLDSFAVAKGVKTFISINVIQANNSIRIQKMPEVLTPYERSLWSKYMLLVENNFGSNYAYINSGNALYLLNHRRTYSNPILVGPLPNTYAHITVKNRFSQGFETEGVYQYLFQKGLTKQKQLKNVYPFSVFLSPNVPAFTFRDYVLTEDVIDSLWQEYLYNRSAATDLFTNPSLNKQDNGQLQIGITTDSSGKEPSVRNIFLFKYNDPDFLRIYRGAARDFGYVPPGRYRIMLLLKDDTYFIKDSIFIKKDGVNYYETGIIQPKKKDSVSIRISTIIDNRDNTQSRNSSPDDFNGIKESFNQKYLDPALLTEIISGVIRDKKGRPLPGATIMIKGTVTGTQSDKDGRFILKAMPNSTIVVTTIGYSTEEKKLRSSDDISFSLSPMNENLSEVIVIGYGVSRRKDLTGSVSIISGDMFLQGKIAGVNVDGLAGSSEFIRIRGISSLTQGSAPLIILDGLPYSGNMEEIDTAIVGNVEVLKQETATALYGSRAVNGVVIITTKKAITNNVALSAENMSMPGNSIRKNFRDDAFWQPRLRTNNEGKASFNVTYPDDITAWKTFAIAMTDNKQTGYAEGLVKSFKAISGNLSFPQFSVEGDSITAIGKSLNYLMDSISARRSFFINNQLAKESLIYFRNSWIDTFSVAATNTDSLKLKYTIQKENGYFDGEERSIPVFRQGVLEATGMFASLRGDTSFRLQPLSDTGTIKIYAEASVFPVLEKEVDNLHSYEYLCNEQLASKLKGWLVQKKIDAFLKRPFKGDKYINELISKLSQAKSSAGLWGWWNNNEPTMWISLHALEALAGAQSAGYSVSLNKQMLTDYLIYTIESYKGTEKAAALNLLFALGAKADYKKYIDTLQKDLPKMSLYERLQLTELSQKAGIPVLLDTLLAKQSRTMLGNIYWGEEGYRFFDNAIQNTILMYRILKAAGAHSELLEKMRGYFLERRKSGYWRNTYESSLILETILPDLLVNDSLPASASLTIAGDASQTIKAFPFSAEVKNGQRLSISKSGSLPVYFTAYQQRWNPSPKKVSGDFTVRSSFEKDGKELTHLKGGEPVQLKIAVSVRAEANYIMIEAPIPAGCSYKEKNQSWANNEVHREYFKNKVSLFCSSLKKGEYVFTVSLLPRYSGRYIVNPAKAELMYFPVLYGREEMKKITIQ